MLRREKSISREVPRGQLYCSSLVGFLAILLTILLAQVQCTCIVHLFHLQFAYYTKPKCLLFRVSLRFFCQKWLILIFWTVLIFSQCAFICSVPLKPGFSIGNQNQGPISVLILEPKHFLPKSKLFFFHSFFKF